MYREFSYANTGNYNIAMNISVIAQAKYISSEEWASSATVASPFWSEAGTTPISTRNSYTVVSAPPVLDRLVFQALKKKWHQERGHTSSTTKIVLCPSYQKIMGMSRSLLK